MNAIYQRRFAVCIPSSLFSVLVLSAATSRADHWETGASMPTARSSLAAATSGDGNLIYALGGNTSIVPAVPTAEVYDVRTDAWTAVVPMPAARQLGAAANLEEDICIFGGLDPAGFVLARTDCYRFQEGTWSTRSAMHAGRYALAGTTSTDQGKIYAIGGTDFFSTFRTVEVFTNSTGTWTTVAPMLTKRKNLAAATGPDDRVYVFGGLNEDGVILSSAEVYDPRTDSWSQIPSMPTARTALAAASSTDRSKIYLLGGQNNAGLVSVVDVYDVLTQSWSAVDSIPTARSWLAAATGPGDRIYAVGGRRGTTWLDTVEVYLPSGSPGGWSAAPSMDVGREGLAATTGLDGKVYVLGGSINGVVQRIVEVFEPSLGEWSSIAPMPTPRAGLACLRPMPFLVQQLAATGQSTAWEAAVMSTTAFPTIRPLPTTR